MRNFVLTATIASLLCFVSCSEKKSETGSALDSKVLELIQSVPSDALAIVSSERCEDALELLDSSDVLRALELGELADSRAVLSFCYEGSLVPVLCISTGRRASDSSANVASVISQARAHKLQAHFTSDEEQHSSSLILTRSQSQMNAVKRHIIEGSSVLEAHGFRQALARIGSEQNFIIIRNNGARRLLPKITMEGTFQRNALCRFAERLSDWLCVVPQRGGGYEIFTSQDNYPKYFAEMLGSLSEGRSEALSIVPDTTDFVLSFSMSSPESREAYESYLDANVKLTEYRNRIQGLKEKYGKDPLKWEKEIESREVVLLHWEGACLALLRSDRRLKDQESGSNPYPGFIPALYGEAFRINDDSSYAIYDNWYIFGSKDDVDAFIAYSTERDTKHKPSPSSAFVVARYKDMTLEWNKKEINLWKSSQ